MRGPRSGRFRDKVTIQSPPTNDNYGHPVGDWSDVKTLNCDINQVRSGEAWAQASERVKETYTIRFRYNPAHKYVRYNRRIVDKRVSPWRYFDIESIDNVENEKCELIIVCSLRK